MMISKMKKCLKIGFILILAVMLSACYRGRPSEKPPIHLNPNMDNQPKYRAQGTSKFFLDGSAMRIPIPGTVARGELYADPAYYFGKDENGNFVKTIPLSITLRMLKRGQERYNIYCAPCHGRTGDGRGIVVQRGYLPPPSFHQDYMRAYPDGQIYDVINRGIRNMPAYGYMIPVEDRWAIVAYFKALLRAQNATSNDIPEAFRDKIN